MKLALCSVKWVTTQSCGCVTSTHTPGFSGIMYYSGRQQQCIVVFILYVYMSGNLQKPKPAFWCLNVRNDHGYIVFY